MSVLGLSIVMLENLSVITDFEDVTRQRERTPDGGE